MRIMRLQKKYSYGKQTIDEKDIDAVREVLRSGWLTQGPKIEIFESKLCKKFGSKYASAVSSGTAALHLTGLALNWSKKDIILTSPITFLASANCILYSGGIPDFVDIDSRYYTIDPNKLETKILHYKKKSRRIKAVIAVDFAGNPCDWKSLRYLADKHGFSLINDNCHALGAEYFSDIKYAQKYADVVIQSYHPVKHITTGEGGAVLTNSKETDKTIKLLRSHGMVKKLSGSAPSWYYEMHRLGYNYRISDIQCALGISQLKKLQFFLKRRREIAKLYDKLLGESEYFTIPSTQKNSRHSYHLYPLLLNFNKLHNMNGKSDTKKVNLKQLLFKRLSHSGINCQVHYIPVHLQPYYSKNYGFKKGDFPISEEFYEREISIPIYPLLTNNDIRYIADEIKKAFF